MKGFEFLTKIKIDYYYREVHVTKQAMRHQSALILLKAGMAMIAYEIFRVTPMWRISLCTWRLQGR